MSQDDKHFYTAIAMSMCIGFGLVIGLMLGAAL